MVYLFRYQVLVVLLELVLYHLYLRGFRQMVGCLFFLLVFVLLLPIHSLFSLGATDSGSSPLISSIVSLFTLGVNDISTSISSNSLNPHDSASGFNNLSITSSETSFCISIIL